MRFHPRRFNPRIQRMLQRFSIAFTGLRYIRIPSGVVRSVISTGTDICCVKDMPACRSCMGAAGAISVILPLLACGAYIQILKEVRKLPPQSPQ